MRDSVVTGRGRSWPSEPSTIPAAARQWDRGWTRWSLSWTVLVGGVSSHLLLFPHLCPREAWRRKSSFVSAQGNTDGSPFNHYSETVPLCLATLFSFGCSHPHYYYYSTQVRWSRCPQCGIHATLHRHASEVQTHNPTKLICNTNMLGRMSHRPMRLLARRFPGHLSSSQSFVD